MFYRFFHELCGDRPEYLYLETYLIFRNIYPEYDFMFDDLGYILDGGFKNQKPVNLRRMRHG